MTRKRKQYEHPPRMAWPSAFGPPVYTGDAFAFDIQQKRERRYQKRYEPNPMDQTQQMIGNTSNLMIGAGGLALTTSIVSTLLKK